MTQEKAECWLECLDSDQEGIIKVNRSLSHYQAGEVFGLIEMDKFGVLLLMPFAEPLYVLI